MALAADDFRRNLPRFADDAMQTNARLVAALQTIAARRGVTPAQVALAWVLAPGPACHPDPRHQADPLPRREPRCRRTSPCPTTRSTSCSGSSIPARSPGCPTRTCRSCAERRQLRPRSRRANPHGAPEPRRYNGCRSRQAPVSALSAIPIIPIASSRRQPHESSFTAEGRRPRFRRAGGPADRHARRPRPVLPQRIQGLHGRRHRLPLGQGCARSGSTW